MSCKEKKTTAGGLSPQEALSSFQVADGFKIEPVASSVSVKEMEDILAFLKN